LPARIELVEDLGDSAVVDLAVGETVVKMRSEARPAAREGDTVRIVFAAHDVHLFDPGTGARL